MKNVIKEFFKCIFSLFFIVSISFILMGSSFKLLDTLEVVSLGFVLGLSVYYFINSIIYFYKFLTYKNIVESNTYTVENRRKYNKFGPYYINRGVIDMGKKKIRGNWSIDFEKISHYASPLKCKSNGADMIIIG